ncbi:MAG: AAA family ATPase [Actinomycetota bacterium]
MWEILGFARVSEEIADVLAHDDEIPVIEGPSGSGKSSLAQQIGGIWAENGGTTIVALGDRLQSEVDFYPLASAIAPLTREWRIWARALTNAAPAGEALALGTGGKISGVVRALSGLRRRTRRARRLFIGEQEQRVLFDLERLSRKRPLLLVADNLHWWDQESLALLGRLREPRILESFPFLNQMRMLVVQTPPPDQETSNPAAVKAFLRPSSTRRFSLERPDRADFAQVLVGLGAPVDQLPEVYDSVYRLTGGHLALAKRCAARLADDEADRERFVAQMDSGDFIHQLLTERIESLGALGQEAVRLLQTAAILGLSFRRDEIVCAVDANETPVGTLLRYCQTQDMIELKEDRASFVHDLYREHFLRSPNFDQVAVHERLADCFRQLRPADYQLRCENALQAARPLEAGSLATQAVIAAHQNGLPRSSLRPAVEDALKASGLEEVAAQLVEALIRLDAADSLAGETVLASTPHDLPAVVRAEADLIRASALLLTRSGTDRARGLSMLEHWTAMSLAEPDLDARLLRAQLYGRALEPDKTVSFALEGQLRSLLSQRSSVDQSAADELYVLDRCSAAIHEPEVAIRKVSQAVDHFADAGADTIRRPTEFYFALMNLAAENLVAGRFEDALEVSKRLDKLVSDFEPGTFQKLDFPRSNQLLAEFRLGVVDPADAAEQQGEIIARHTSSDDPFYPKNALAIYLAFAGEVDRSLQIYDALLDQLALRREPETSMVYVLRANRCAVKFVHGDWDGVLDEWVQLDGVVRQIAYPIAHFYIKRHELLLDVISEGGSWTMESFDTCLTTGGRVEIGPQWQQLGRGFRLPEIMWWL